MSRLENFGDWPRPRIEDPTPKTMIREHKSLSDNSNVGRSDYQFSIARLLMATTVCGLLMGLAPEVIFDIPRWMILILAVVVILFADWDHRHLHNGHAAMAAGNFSRAIELYGRAIKARPGDSEGYYYRALAHHRRWDVDEAIRDYTQAIQLNSRFPLAWTGRGHVNLHHGQSQEAIDDATVALCMDSETVDAIFVRAAAYHQLNRVEDALEDLDAAVSAAPTDWRAYSIRADIHLSAQEPLEAIRNYEKAIELGAGDLIGIALAVARFRVGEHETAIRATQEYCEKHPEAVDALCIHAWFLATCSDDALRNGKQALELAKRAREITTLGYRWSCESSLAAAHAEIGEFDKAVEHGEKAVDLAPPLRREDFQLRLATYKSGQPFRDRSE